MKVFLVMEFDTQTDYSCPCGVYTSRQGAEDEVRERESQAIEQSDRLNIENQFEYDIYEIELRDSFKGLY